MKKSDFQASPDVKLIRNWLTILKGNKFESCGSALYDNYHGVPPDGVVPRWIIEPLFD